MMDRQSGFSAPFVLVGIVLVGAIVGITCVLFLTKTSREITNEQTLESGYDLDRLRKIDPRVIIYEETAPRIETGFQSVGAVAVGPEDHIYIAGDKAIHVYDPAGQKLPDEIQLNQQPTAMTIAKDITIYVALGDHVEVFDSSGGVTQRWESAGPDAILTSIAVSGDHVFVADFGSRSVIHYDTSGTKKGSFGDFILPSPFFDLAVSPDGLVQVANTGKHRIEAFAFDGDLMSWWGEFSNTNIEGFCGCCNPVNFALLPKGKGFVVAEKGLTRVKAHDEKGAFVGVVAGPEQFAEHDRLSAESGYDRNRGGLDVAVDSKGRVLVLDLFLAELRTFERKSQPQNENGNSVTGA